MSEPTEDTPPTLESICENFAEAYRGGMYRLYPVVQAFFQSIVAIHIAECEQTQQDMEIKYADTKSSRDWNLAQYNRHGAGVLKAMYSRLEGGYKRNVVSEYLAYIISNIPDEANEDASIHTGAVTENGVGVTGSRGIGSNGVAENPNEK